MAFMRILVGIHPVSSLLQRQDGGDAWLNDDERARLQAMRHPRRRQQFLAGHVYARQLLARYTNARPDDFDLTRGEHGAPLVLRDGEATSLHVSLSHSAELLACAVATVPIGLDIEAAEKPRDILRLASSLYPPVFLEMLEKADDSLRRQRFYERWTLDEARAKADGRGLMLKQLGEQLWQPGKAGAADGWTWRLDDVWVACATTVVPESVPQFVFDREHQPPPPGTWTRVHVSR